LISHDDAFEGLQDQVIRVVAGQGGQPSTIAGTPTPVDRAVAPGLTSEPLRMLRDSAALPSVAWRKPRRSKEAAPG
jgi:hypothetical protein